MHLFWNSSNWTFDDKEFVETHMGHRRIWSLPVTIVVTTIYTAIFVAGVAGNIVMCIVIVKNRHLQTATNYYLFSLATSDVLTLILGES